MKKHVKSLNLFATLAGGHPLGVINLISAGIIIWLLNLSLNCLGQSETGEKTCADCHGSLIEQEVIHPPAEETCDVCHEPTGKEHPLSDVKGFSLSEKMPLLCYACHDEKNTKKNVHYPVEEGECMVCHSPHSSANQSLLISSPTSKLCEECHDVEMTKKRVQHKPVSDGNCQNCHDPHQSDYSVFLKFEEKKLCLSCHNKTITTKSKKIGNIKQMIKKGKIVHGVIESDGCVVCHSPHASDNNFLLVSSFPIGDYAPAKTESFALCFNCHDSELLETAVSTTATSFRNGDQNLHYLHINGNKGINCNNCHNVHGSLHEHLIAEKVPFGNWEMPVKFTLRENGGSCSPGCHKEEKYER